MVPCLVIFDGGLLNYIRIYYGNSLRTGMMMGSYRDLHLLLPDGLWDTNSLGSSKFSA